MLSTISYISNSIGRSLFIILIASKPFGNGCWRQDDIRIMTVPGAVKMAGVWLIPKLPGEAD